MKTLFSIHNQVYLGYQKEYLILSIATNDFTMVDQIAA